MAQSTHGRTSDATSDLKEQATEQVRRAANQAQETAGRVADQGREASERMQEVAGNFKGALEKSLRDQPMATLATAAVAGFVLGALWKS